MTLSDQRATATAQTIQINHNSIAAIEHEVKMVEHGLAYSARISGHLAEQVHMSSLLLSRMEEIRNSISQLIQARISPQLIPPSILKDVLHQVSASLSRHHPKFQIAHVDIAHYYHHALFVAARHETSIFITLKIPITAFHSSFTVYKVHSLPVPLNHSTSHGTYLDNLPRYMPNIQDHLYFSTMTTFQWNSCHGKHTKHCPREVFLRPVNRKVCVLAIFQQIKQMLSNTATSNWSKT